MVLASESSIYRFYVKNFHAISKYVSRRNFVFIYRDSVSIFFKIRDFYTAEEPTVSPFQSHPVLMVHFLSL